LKKRYGEIIIPAAVEQELLALSHVEANSRINAARTEGWLVIDKRPIPVVALPFPLDPGESDAIALAVALRADVLLIDEKQGRAAARHLGLATGGVLGELLHARQHGLISDLRTEIKRLRTGARFFIDPAIEKYILSEAGE
jgi:uncharacterized protein